MGSRNTMQNIKCFGCPNGTLENEVLLFLFSVDNELAESTIVTSGEPDSSLPLGVGIPH